MKTIRLDFILVKWFFWIPSPHKQLQSINWLCFIFIYACTYYVGIYNHIFILHNHNIFYGSIFRLLGIDESTNILLLLLKVRIDAIIIYYYIHVRHRTPSSKITIRTLYTIGTYVYYTIIIYNNIIYLHGYMCSRRINVHTYTHIQAHNPRYMTSSRVT